MQTHGLAKTSILVDNSKNTPVALLTPVEEIGQKFDSLGVLFADK